MKSNPLKKLGLSCWGAILIGIMASGALAQSGGVSPSAPSNTEPPSANQAPPQVQTLQAPVAKNTVIRAIRSRPDVSTLSVPADKSATPTTGVRSKELIQPRNQIQPPLQSQPRDEAGGSIFRGAKAPPMLLPRLEGKPGSLVVPAQPISKAVNDPALPSDSPSESAKPSGQAPVIKPILSPAITADSDSAPPKYRGYGETAVPAFELEPLQLPPAPKTRVGQSAQHSQDQPTQPEFPLSPPSPISGDGKVELPVRMRIPNASPLPIDPSSISQPQESSIANSEFATVPATQPIIEAPSESVVMPFMPGPDVAVSSPSDIPTVPAPPAIEAGVPMILPFGNPLVPSPPPADMPPVPTYAGQEYQSANGLPQSNPDVPLAEPYWVDILTRSNNAENQKAIWLDYDQAIWDALAHSPYVKSTLTLPLQMQAKVAEESGIFDSTPFVDSIFKDNSDPVGNTLTTGGPNRSIELNSDNGMGVRRKNQYGGSAELSQNILLRDNNSVFLKPHQQADTKMMLKLNQPLMRGAGSTYATASIRIAEFNAGVSQHETMRKLQLHAAEVSRVYWDLFAARSSMLQSERGMQRLVSLRDQLNARADVDVLKSQQLRAQSAVMGQAKSYARAQADMITAQANLRRLINSPSLQQSSGGIIPRTAPIDQPFVVNAGSELESALAFHPDIMANRDRLKAATTRLKVAENELRPTLNLVVESYVRGLNGDYGVSDSVADQFARGRPSATAGLNYQRPYRNIAAKAILRERRLELQNLLYELDNTLLTVTASVEQAVAELNSSFNQLEAAVYATIAADQDVRYLDMRWRNAFGDGSQPALILDELLSAHVQLIESERSWAQAEADHMKAFTNLHLATGSLLNSVQVNLPE